LVADIGENGEQGPRDQDPEKALETPPPHVDDSPPEKGPYTV